MRYLPILLALLIGCGTTDSNEFQEYKIGTWLVSSEYTSDWIGSKAKSDTVIITQADGYQWKVDARVEAPTNYSSFELTYVDSSLNIGNMDGSKSEYTLELPHSTTKSSFANYSSSTMINEDRFQKEYLLSYNCQRSELVEGEYIQFSIVQSDTLFRAYQFDTTGFIDMLHQVVCP